MKRKKFLLRISAFILALFLAVGTPVGDYICVRNTVTSYAMGGIIGSAVQWLWASVMAMCGVTVTNTSSLDQLSSSIIDYASAGAMTQDQYNLMLKLLAKVSWGAVVNVADGISDIVTVTKNYFKQQPNYGTSAGITAVAISPVGSYSQLFNIDISPYASPDHFICRTQGFGFNPADLYVAADYSKNHGLCIELYYAGGTNYQMRFVGIIDGAIQIVPFKRLSYYDANTGNYTIVLNSDGRDNPIDFLDSSYGPDISSIADVFPGIQIPVFKLNTDLSISDATKKYLRTGTIDKGSCAITNTNSVAVHSIPDVQQREITSVGDLTVPSSVTEAEKVYQNVTSTVDSTTMVGALAPSVDITYGDAVVRDPADTGTDTDTFPWVPDITGALNSILDVIYDIGDSLSDVRGWIRDIPQTLVDIKNGILTIPKSIADFFTIDFAQVKQSALTLKSSLLNKFGGLTEIVNVFKASTASLNSQIPVMKIRVPDDLAPIIGSHEIIVFDLRGFETYVTLFRNLVRCSIWLTFAFAVIGMFRVRFGID